MKLEKETIAIALICLVVGGIIGYFGSMPRTPNDAATSLCSVSHQPTYSTTVLTCEGNGCSQPYQLHNDQIVVSCGSSVP
jgi:hypothetical protein